MSITFQTTEDERKQIRKLNRGELGEDVELILDPIMKEATERAGRRIN